MAEGSAMADGHVNARCPESVCRPAYGPRAGKIDSATTAGHLPSRNAEGMRKRRITRLASHRRQRQTTTTGAGHGERLAERQLVRRSLSWVRIGAAIVAAGLVGVSHSERGRREFPVLVVGVERLRYGQQEPGPAAA